MFHVGLAATQKDRASSIRFRARPEAHFSGRFVNTGSIPANDALIYNLELAGVFDSLWFAAEYTQADVDVPVGSDPSFAGVGGVAAILPVVVPAPAARGDPASGLRVESSGRRSIRSMQPIVFIVDDDRVVMR